MKINTGFLRWIRAVFADSKGEPSSKRAISIIAFLLLAVGFTTDLFSDYTVNEYMWDGMITLVIFGLGFVASEKFSGILGGKSNSTPPSAPPRIEPPYKGDDYTPGGNCDCNGPKEDESQMI